MTTPPSSQGPIFGVARKGYERAAVDAEMSRLHAALREQRIRTMEAERRVAEAEQETLALRRQIGGGPEIGEKAAGLLREIAELERNLRTRAVEEADAIVQQARQQAAQILSEAGRGTDTNHEAIARRAALERTLAELEDDRAALIGQLEWLAAHLLETTGRLRTEGPQVATGAQVIDLRNPGGSAPG